MLTDLVGKQVQLMISTIALPHIKSGKLRASAVTGDGRSPSAGVWRSTPSERLRSDATADPAASLPTVDTNYPPFAVGDKRMVAS